MAIKRGGKYYCPFCDKEFADANVCDSHRDKEHDVVYVPIQRSDLNRLINFIYSKNDDYLTTTLMKTLQQYLKGNRE